MNRVKVGWDLDCSQSLVCFVPLDFDFRRVHETKQGEIGTFDKNRDPNGQKGPYRDPGP